MNMNIKLLAGALLGVLALTQSATVEADDIKAHHGSECKVYGTTPWSALGFGWQGVFNASDTPKVIVCPLVKDSESDWDSDATTPTNAAYVDVHYRTPPQGGSITCTAYTSRAGGLTSTKTFSDSPGGFGNWNNDILGLVSSGNPNDAGSIMICNLGDKVSLQHYRLIEPGATGI